MGAVSLNPRYTFARFVVGPSNDAAVASASAVAVAPGRAYNPLFLYGDTGLGKTHLMQAVAHAVLDRRPATRVEYVSAEAFTNDLVAAVQQGSAGVFHERFARAELLLVDDVHVLAGRAAAQAAFAEVFTVLYESGRQIMLTSDRAPQSLGLDAVLVGRFKWGRVVDVSRPDAAHRLAIVRAKLDADSLGETVPDEVAAFVAEHVRTNVRALEGALVRVVAHAAVRPHLRMPVTRHLTELAADHPCPGRINHCKYQHRPFAKNGATRPARPGPIDPDIAP